MGSEEKQKIIEIPQREREGILQIMPRGTNYFDEARRSFLMGQASDEENSLKKIEKEARMLDDRVIQDQDFIKDDAFIKTNEF